MTIIFCYRGLGLGGIESVLTKAANAMTGYGNKVYVVANSGAYSNFLAESIQTRSFESPSAIADSIFSDLEHEGSESPREILMLSFDPLSNFFSELLGQHILSKMPGLIIRHASGVFHPRAYLHETDNWKHRLLNFILARSVGCANLFFMNESCQQTHARRLGRRARSGHVATLPIEPKGLRWKPRRRVKLSGSICSVGRIVKFKAYNFVVPEIVSHLRSQGLCLRWDIFGYGQEEKSLRDAIEAHDVEEYVRFLGPLPMNEFHDTVLKYDLFVGMGTASLEASSVGVPAVICIDNEPYECAGFVGDAPQGYVGEALFRGERYKLSSLIAEFLRSPEEDMVATSRKGHQSLQNIPIGGYVKQLREILCSAPKLEKSILSRLMLTAYFSIAHKRLL